MKNSPHIIQSNPDNANARSRLGDCYKQANNIAAAVEQWELASQIYEQEQQHGKVIKLCQKIIDLRPNHPGTREKLNQAQLQFDSQKPLDDVIKIIHSEPLTPKPDELEED